MDTFKQHFEFPGKEQQYASFLFVQPLYPYISPINSQRSILRFARRVMQPRKIRRGWTCCTQYTKIISTKK